MEAVITGVDAIHVQLYVPRWIDFSEGDGKKSPKAQFSSDAAATGINDGTGSRRLPTR